MTAVSMAPGRSVVLIRPVFLDDKDCAAPGRPLLAGAAYAKPASPDNAAFGLVVPGLQPGRFAAAGAWIGGAEQTLWRDRDRIGGGLAQRFDDGMPLGLQRREHIRREAV